MPLTGIRSFIGFVDDVSDDNDDGGNCSDGSATFVIDLLVVIFIERDGIVLLFAFVMSFLLGEGKASALLLMCNTPSGTDCTIGEAIFTVVASIAAVGGVTIRLLISGLELGLWGIGCGAKFATGTVPRAAACCI